MKKILSCLLALSVSAPAFCSQLRFNERGVPVCFTGAPESALRELLRLEYDPPLTDARVAATLDTGAPVLYGEQKDPEGWILDTVYLKRCPR